MKVKQFLRISILLIVVFAIVADLGLLQVLAYNMTAPKLPLDETFSWRNGKYERIFYGESVRSLSISMCRRERCFPAFLCWCTGEDL